MKASNFVNLCALAAIAAGATACGTTKSPGDVGATTVEGYDWLAVKPPSTAMYPINTVWLKRDGAKWEPVCASGSSRSAFINPELVPEDEEGVEAWDKIGDKTRETDFSLFASIDPGIVSKQSDVNAGIGFRRVVSYSVDFGTVRTRFLQIDRTNDTDSAAGARNRRCSDQVAAIRKNNPKAFSSLVLITATAKADSMNVTFELNPEDAGGAEVEEGAGAMAPDVRGGARLIAASFQTEEEGGEEAEEPAAEGDEAEAEGEDEHQPEAAKCGFWVDAGGKVLTGASGKLKFNRCTRMSASLSFTDPHYVGYQAMKISDYESVIAGQFTSPRHRFNGAPVTKESVDTGSDFTDEEIAALKAEGFLQELD